MKIKKYMWIIGFSIVILLMPLRAFAMHIAEGYLPPLWCISWGVLTLPFIFAGFISIKKTIKGNPRLKILLAMAGAFMFVLSALKIPSVTGSSSHPTGVGLGTILFGPSAMSVLGLIILIFQAILLAHGGISTLGANTFSMAVAGPFAAYITYRIVKKVSNKNGVAIFLSAAIGDMVTYVTTAVQLSIALPSEKGGVMASLCKNLGIFAVTQIPLAISEGILTVLVFNAVLANGKEYLKSLKVFSGEM